jgi:hypothetical protein
MQMNFQEGIKNLFRRSPVVTETKSSSFNAVAQTQAIGGYAADRNLEQIFCGTDHDYDLAAGSYNKQILTVARLVGTPIIKNDMYPRIQTLLFDEAIIITLRAMINGTHWVLPRLLAGGALGVEHIKDSAIGSGGLRIDPKTGALTAVVLREQVQWLDGDFLNDVYYAWRNRKFTPNEIIEAWEGEHNSREARNNTLEIMPVPFAFNSLGDIRGTSVYSGVLRLLRDMHEIRRNRDEILATAKPKAVIGTGDWNEWTKRNMESNGQKNLYDPFAARVAVNKTDETFEFLILPPGAVQDHNAALEENSKEQIVSSPLPEIFSGKMTTGNYASNEYQQQQGVQFIQSVRNEMLKAWNQLVRHLAALDNYMSFDIEKAPPKITWDNLELASPLTKAQIITNCAGALSTMAAGGIPVEVCFAMLKELQPQMSYKTSGELADAMKKLKTDTPSGDAMDMGSVWG